MLYTSNKGFFTIYISIFVYIYNSCDEVVAIYSILIFLDYVLGYIFSKRNNIHTWQQGLKGAVNKIVSFSIIFVAMLLDYLMISLSNNYNFEFYNTNYISVVTCVFLVVNEGSSIIKNWKLLGLDVPFYLNSVFQVLKKIRK